ncbi:MAG: DNA methyltransferase [Planctomycetia bacterium]|nr:DNA methyltransferase [Planctomycetia bacterium]
MSTNTNIEAVLLGAERVALVQGDAYDLLQNLPAESVDLIITSPPYWGLRDYEAEHNWEILGLWEGGKHAKECPPYRWYREHGGLLGLEPLPEWYVSNLAEIVNQCQRILRLSGNLWLNIGDTYFARWSSIRSKGRQGLNGDERMRRKTPMGGYRQEKQLLLIPARVAITLQECRWILRNDLIWYKPNIPPRPFNDRLGLTHEHFFHFVKRPKEGRAKYYYDLSEAGSSHDVQKVNVVPGKHKHSACFPPRLIEPRIRSSSPPDGIVLDPFAGIGTALEVAVSAGRRVIGFDINMRFLSVAGQRIHNVARTLF